MFTIDTGAEGSQGPWISWTSNGSAQKGFAPKSWVLRDKNPDTGEKTEQVVNAFYDGCVLDLDTLKLGWEKDGAMGQAPERRWNPSIAQSTPRPDDSKKQSGAFAWSRALSVRVGMKGGISATWEQGAFAAYEGFTRLAKQIQAQWEANSQNGKFLPVVVQKDSEHRQLPGGSANIPVFEITAWVERPDSLKADAPKIDTGNAGLSANASSGINTNEAPPEPPKAEAVPAGAAGF